MNPDKHFDIEQQVSNALVKAGFELFETIAVSDLNPRHRDNLPNLGQLPAAKQTLLLVANTGPRFWRVMRSDNTQSQFLSESDPVDSYSSLQVCALMDEILPDTEYRLLYPEGSNPGAPPPPLQALGKLAGWHQTSPLGIGIHPQRGLWFAYRALIIIDLPAIDWVVSSSRRTAVSVDSQIDSPEVVDVCVTCQSQACIAACPSQALSAASAPDMGRCADYRVTEDSDCQDKCLARNACPIGISSRYSTEQTAYHYRVSLHSIKRRIQT